MIDEKKLIERLEEELKLADESKERCARENMLMFDNAKGYATGIAYTIDIINQLAEEYNNKLINRDLISRASLLAVIEGMAFNSKLMNPVIKMMDVLEIIESQPTVYNDGWIPCSERLPEKNGTYLVTQKRYSLDTHRMIGVETDYVRFRDGEWGRAKFFEVIAWQPLPAPYQPKGEVNNLMSATNAEHIKAMTDEELAEFLVNFKNKFGEEHEGKMSCMEWLQSEVE